MKKIVKGNLIFKHALIMEEGSKVYMTGCTSTCSGLMYSKKELEEMPGQHIDDDLILYKDDILVVDGNVLCDGGGSLKSGCEVRKITKEQFEQLERGEEIYFTKYTIKRIPENGGYYCLVSLVDHPNYTQFYGSLCVPPGSEMTECMIFKAKDGEVTDWEPLYAKKDVPFNDYGLDECMDEFLYSLRTTDTKTV